MTAPALPLEGATRCGYCNRRLALQPDGVHWECPRCGPLLHGLGLGESYEAAVAAWCRFQAEAARDWQGP